MLPNVRIREGQLLDSAVVGQEVPQCVATMRTYLTPSEIKAGEGGVGPEDLAQGDEIARAKALVRREVRHASVFK